MASGTISVVPFLFPHPRLTRAQIRYTVIFKGVIDAQLLHFQPTPHPMRLNQHSAINIQHFPTRTPAVTSTPSRTYALTRSWTPSKTLTTTKTPAASSTPTKTRTATATRTGLATRTPTRTLLPHTPTPTPNLATPTAAPGGALPAGQTWTFYRRRRASRTMPVLTALPCA